MIIRLFAARLLAGFPAEPSKPGQAKPRTTPPDPHAFELARDLCSTMLNETANQIAAVWTLGEFSDSSSLATLVAYLRAKPRSPYEVSVMLDAVRIFESISGEQFRSTLVRQPIRYDALAAEVALLVVLWLQDLSNKDK